MAPQLPGGGDDEVQLKSADLEAAVELCEAAALPGRDRRLRLMLVTFASLVLVVQSGSILAEVPLGDSVGAAEPATQGAG